MAAWAEPVGTVADGYSIAGAEYGLTLVWALAAGVVGADNVREAPLHMGAEDFSYFLERRPGCFFFVGSRNPDKRGGTPAILMARPALPRAVPR